MANESWRKNFAGHGGNWTVVASAKDETNKEWLALLQTVGESLRQLRKNQGWSLVEMGRLMGYSKASTMISAVEKARTPGVMLYRIWRTADFLGYKTRIVFEKKERP